jgi:hypothetical protein
MHGGTVVGNAEAPEGGSDVAIAASHGPDPAMTIHGNISGGLGDIWSRAGIVVAENSTLTLAYYTTIDMALSVFENRGTLINYGKITLTLPVNPDFAYRVGLLQNRSSFTNNGEINILGGRVEQFSGAEFVNNGEINLVGGRFDNFVGSTLVNAASGSIDVGSEGMLINFLGGETVNHGEINNMGLFANVSNAHIPQIIDALRFLQANPAFQPPNFPPLPPNLPTFSGALDGGTITNHGTIMTGGVFGNADIDTIIDVLHVFSGIELPLLQGMIEMLPALTPLLSNAITPEMLEVGTAHNNGTILITGRGATVGTITGYPPVFFDPPFTGVSDIAPIMLVMFVFVAASVGLWGYILRRKVRK